VYAPRIERLNETFATRQLGLYGPDLAAIACFFQPPFSAPTQHLAAAEQSRLLNHAGFALRAVGRLGDANMAISLKDATGAAFAFGNLAELYLTLGRLGDAVVSGETALSQSERSEDFNIRVHCRRNCAESALATGRIGEANALISAAEALWTERVPHRPLLFGFAGYFMCDLLLCRGRIAEVIARGRYMQELAGTRWEPLTEAFNMLTISGPHWLIILLLQTPLMSQIWQLATCVKRMLSTNFHVPY